jgi:outer membrane receptor protein involved in Fe transport
MLQSSKPRWQFLLCTALGAALPASAVLAQDTEPAADETIVVTGTRILKPDFDQPNPIVSVDSESIQLSGTTNLTDYLTDQPALVGSLDSTQTSGSAGFIGSTGLNLLNLRNLGTERTLVLVDGRRHVAQLPETAAVDVNTIPVDLIERIDIATGGVSAVYGADAVSGVVNFVMKKDFEGIRARGQLGFATEGEPLDYFASIAAGKNFADGRGNIAAAFEYAHDGRLRSIDRRYLRNPFRRTMQINPNDPDDDPSIPDEIPLTDIRFFDSSRDGAIDLDFDFLPDVLSDGSPFVRPQIIDPFSA